MLSTCNRTEVYAVAERFHGAYHDIRDFLSELGLPRARGLQRPPLRPLRRAGRRPPVRGGRRPRLRRARRERDPRPGQAAPGSGPARRAPPVPPSTCCSATPSRSASGPAPRPASPATSPRCRRPRSPWPPSGSAALDGPHASSCSAPATWARAWRSALAKAGAPRSSIANRTWDTAVALAERVGGRAVRLGDLPAALAEVDVLLTSTGAAAPLARSRRPRARSSTPGAGRPLLIVDIAVPRDVDPAVGRPPRRHAARHGRPPRLRRRPAPRRREGEVAGVRTIVDDELERYLGATSAREVAPLIVALRDRAEAVRQAELERFRARLGELDAAPARGRRGAHPRRSSPSCCTSRSVALKDAAGSPRGDRLVDALRELFDLDDDAAPPPRSCCAVRAATRGSRARRAGRPSTSPRCCAPSTATVEVELVRRRDAGRPAARRPDLGARRQGRVRQGGAGRGARRPGRPRRALGQGPAVGHVPGPGARRRARAGRSPRRAGRVDARRPARGRRGRHRLAAAAGPAAGATGPTSGSSACAATCTPGSPRRPTHDAIVVAAAALDRLGLADQIAELLAVDVDGAAGRRRARSPSSAARATTTCARVLAAHRARARPAGASTPSGPSSPSWAATARCRPARTR